MLGVYSAHISDRTCFCDSCGREIYMTRFICIKCIPENFANTLDICMKCVDENASRDQLEHDKTHSMLKFENIAQFWDIAWMVPKAQAISRRVKSGLRELERIAKSGNMKTTPSYDMRHSAQQTTEMVCACCGRVISAPFWVCVECGMSLVYRLQGKTQTFNI